MIHETYADRIVEFGLVLSLVAITLEALSGIGSRMGVWYFRTGFTMLKVAAFGGGIATVLALAGGVLARHEHRPVVFSLAAAGIVIGLLAAGIPWAWEQRAMQVPRIHDITTDTLNPPSFRAVLPLREGAQNPAVYGGPEIAAEQLRAYPDIRPLLLPSSHAESFEKALAAAKSMDWKIVESNAAEGRIEAVDTTFWFGFQDDIVVRVTQAPEGSRVDVRSLSRVGLSDVGTNAGRIRAYLGKLKG